MQKQRIDCDTVMRFATAASVQEAWQVMREIAAHCGFDYTIYGTNRLRRSGVFGDRGDTFFLSDLPEPFMNAFWGKELYRTTPVALWASQNTGSVSLQYGADLYHNGQLDPTQHHTQKVFMDIGVTSGYVIALHPPNAFAASILGLLNFGRSQEETDEIWAKNKEKIEALAQIFHLKVSSLPVPLKNKRLTARQSEVLKWIGEGKTMVETATILGLSAATVEKHLRQARDTLGVSTTTQAVLHAQINSQIFSVEQ